MEGAAGVAYELGGGGMPLRSTDYGATWTTIPIPGLHYYSNINTHFAVWGPMGENVAAVAIDTLWIFSHGGDGTLGVPSTDDTVYYTSQCNGASISIPIHGAGDSVTSLTSIVKAVEDSLNEFKFISSSNFHLLGDTVDTLQLQYTPHSVPSTSTLRLSFRNSWRCSDWTDTQTVIVNTPPTAIALAPPQLSGGCSIVSESGSISIDSCQSLAITSVTIPSPASNRLTFQSSVPDTIGSNYHNGLPFQFDPRDTVANDSVRVEIKGKYVGSTTTFDTIIIIYCAAHGVAPQLSSSASTLDFGALSTCNGSHDTSVTFTNNGCAPDTITSLTLTGYDYTSTNAVLPIILQIGDSVTLYYHFAPTDSGLFAGIVHLNFSSTGGKDSLSIALSGTGVQGLGILGLATTVLNAGSFSFCAGDTTLSDTISNTGCDTLVVSNINFSGDIAFSLVSSIRRFAFTSRLDPRFSIYFCSPRERR